MEMLKGYPIVSQEMKIVQEILEQSVRSRQPVITKACGELLNAGGKRLRPLLVVLAGMLGKYNRDKITHIAAAVELIHMATLVHDDIIDDSDLRRGMATVQAKWGKDVAVFVGDYLLCKALLMIPEGSSPEGLKKLTRAVKMVCEGEINQYHQRYNTKLGIVSYLKRIASKTAILFGISCCTGAYESKCGKPLIRTITSLGANIGMAFQITDDLLDFTGKVSLLGKPVQNDFVQGIYTLPVIWALQHPDYGVQLEKYLSPCTIIGNTAIAAAPHDFEYITDIVVKSGGIEFGRKLAQRYLERGRANLRQLPDGISKAVMGQLLEEIMERTA